MTQGELDPTPSTTTNPPEETLERGGGKAASEEQEKPEGEKNAESGDAGSGEAAAVPANGDGAGHGHGHGHGGAGVSLGSWERKGLRPLLEVSPGRSFFCLESEKKLKYVRLVERNHGFCILAAAIKVSFFPQPCCVRAQLL